MKICRFNHLFLLSFALLALTLSACGGSPWRYDPAAPAKPVGLSASPGNGQVSLTWSAAENAAAYNVYYSTTPGVGTASATRIANISSSSTIVTGLANDVTYYFAISAVNSGSESVLSDQVSSTPSAPGSFQQTDLQGIWNFNALVSGSAARWMRGSLTIDGTGAAAVTSFLDSAGNSVVPADLFTTLTIQPDGIVQQTGTSSDFQGALSANQHRDILVATANTGGTSRMILIMQKRVAGIGFSVNDIKGTGNLVAGALTFVYHQLSSGVNQEWEYASGQSGQDQAVKYASINAPTARQLPGGGSKVVSLSITSDGIVSESPIAGVQPQPGALLKNAVMSADKMTIVGTATDTNGAFVLRVIQMIHPPSIALTTTTYTAGDLPGSYAVLGMSGGADPLWSFGKLGLDTSGSGAYTDYRDSSGVSALPAPFSLAMNQQGDLTDSAAPSFNGHLSYLNDMIVATGTDAAGSHGLKIFLKQ